MGSLVADVKYALRAIRKQPGASFVVAVTLALGLGVNATVLGMMDALLLRPVPVPRLPAAGRRLGDPARHVRARDDRSGDLSGLAPAGSKPGATRRLAMAPMPR